MPGASPITGISYLNGLNERMGSSLSDDDCAMQIKRIVESSKLIDDYNFYRMRTFSNDHHKVDRLFAGRNVCTNVLSEVAELAEMDVFLIHKENNIACNLANFSVGEAIDEILEGAGLCFRKIPKGDRTREKQIRSLHKVGSLKNCRKPLYTFIRVMHWLGIEVVLQYNTTRTARVKQLVSTMTHYSSISNKTK